MRLTSSAKQGLAVFLAALLLGACANDKSAAPSLSHTPAWSDTTSGDFHGIIVMDAKSPLSCTGCHGTDYAGGQSRVSCYACHSTYPHRDGWTNPTSPLAHGSMAADSIALCKRCHGADLKGGRSHSACTICHDSLSVAFWR